MAADRPQYKLLYTDTGGTFTDTFVVDKALVYERNPGDGEVFRGPKGGDPDWVVLREFYCPGCGAQLDVEAVPPGYPFIFKALPDIDGFYDKHPELKKKILG